MADRTNTDPARMEKIVSLCKRRGFIFQSAEIYGGLNGCWDYGPMGVELKRNLKEYWWRKNVQEREDVVGMDGSILTHNSVLVASGHVGGFSDQGASACGPGPGPERHGVFLYRSRQKRRFLEY